MFKKTNSLPDFDSFDKHKILYNKQLNYNKKQLHKINNSLLETLDLPKDPKYRSEERSFLRYFDITHFGMNDDKNIRELWFASEERYNFMELCLDSFITSLGKNKLVSDASN